MNGGSARDAANFETRDLRSTYLVHMRLARADFSKLLLAIPATRFAVTPLPAQAVIGEVLKEGFFQSDDKSWDFTLPSAAWKVDQSVAPRAEHPKRLFHVFGGRTSGASFEVTVEPNDGRKSAAELGKIDKVAEKLAAKVGGSLEKSDIVEGLINGERIKGSKYYLLEYRLANGGTTLVKLDAKQSRTYTIAATLPSSASADVKAEALSLVESFKSFPVNIMCVTQSNGGNIPASGSCY